MREILKLKYKKEWILFKGFSEIILHKGRRSYYKCPYGIAVI